MMRFLDLLLDVVEPADVAEGDRRLGRHQEAVELALVGVVVGDHLEPPAGVPAPGKGADLDRQAVPQLGVFEGGALADGGLVGFSALAVAVEGEEGPRPQEQGLRRVRVGPGEGLLGLSRRQAGAGGEQAVVTGERRALEIAHQGMGLRRLVAVEVRADQDHPQLGVLGRAVEGGPQGGEGLIVHVRRPRSCPWRSPPGR